MIDLWQANIQVIIAVGFTLTVVLLVYIAFFKDSVDQTHSRNKK